MPALKSERLWISIQNCGTGWAQPSNDDQHRFAPINIKISGKLETPCTWNSAQCETLLPPFRLFHPVPLEFRVCLVEYSLNNQYATSNSNPETSILFNCILTFYCTKQWFFTMKIIDLSEWQTGVLFLGCQYTWTIPYKNLERCQGDKWMMFKRCTVVCKHSELEYLPNDTSWYLTLVQSELWIHAVM